MGQAMVLILVNLAFTFAVPASRSAAISAASSGGIVATYGADALPGAAACSALGFLIAVGVGVASFALAYVRVRGYVA